MEIFIIGAILVALMAYVSTKIKNAAKEAYQQESVVNEYFIITKPNDFIIPVKEKSEILFETHSKDFGEDETEKYYQCWAIVEEKNEDVVDTELLEAEKTEENVTIKTFSKTLVNKNSGRSYKLEILLLPEYQEKYKNGIKLMLDSFSLK